MPKEQKPKSYEDGLIYKAVKERLAPGELVKIAKQYKVSPAKARRIMLGYYNPNHGNDKALRDTVLTAVKTANDKLLRELRSIGLSNVQQS